MHPRVFAEFERICRERRAGGDVLEVGAVAVDDTLLCLEALAGARSKVGVNLGGGAEHRGFQIMQANANDLSCFADRSFDTVLSNAVLEHDPFFWRSLAEMRRVTRSGGLIVIGVPGFTELSIQKSLGRLARSPFLRGRLRAAMAPLAASTLTLQIHQYPGDYYRFSPQAVREVFLEGLQHIEVHTLLLPPRIIGAGVKP